MPSHIQFFLGTSSVAGGATTAGVYLAGESTLTYTSSAAFTSTAGAGLAIGGALVLVGASFFVYKAAWNAQTKIIKLKEKMIENFDRGLKYLIFNRFINIYESMV